MRPLPALIVVFCVICAGVRAQEIDPVKQADLADAQGREAERRGLTQEAIAHHERALDIATRAGLTAAMRRAYDELVDLYDGTGNHAKFFEYTRLAFELTPNPTARDRASYHDRLGWAYQELHEVEKSEENFAEAYRLGRTLNDAPFLAAILANWGILYGRTDIDVPRALRLYDEGLALLRDRSDPRSLNVLSSLLNSSANLMRDHPATYDEALRRYRISLDLARRLDPTMEPFALKNMGRVLRFKERAAESEEALLEAVRLADLRGMARIRWQARMELGTLLASKDPARAERYYRETLDLLEGQHSNVLLEDYNAGALGRDLMTYDNPYELLVSLLVARGRLSDAWAVAERARARVFLDMLTSVRGEIAARLPADYAAREKELLSEISKQQTLLRSQPSSGQREIEAKIARAEEQLTAIRMQLVADHPEIAQARYPHLATPSEIQQRMLNTDEAVLEYFVGATKSFLWVLRRTRIDVFTLPGRGELSPAIADYLAVLSTPASDYRSKGQSLASALIPREAPLDGVRRLIVVPDGLLHYLPFEALPIGDGRFLVERHLVSYAPSASSLAFLRSRPVAPAGNVIAIGDASMRSAGKADERSMASIERVAFLKPLRQAGRELAAVAATYRGSTRVLARDAATETALDTPDLARAAIVHFATHGVIDEEAPQRSGLALTMAPPSDGILQMREIYRLHLNAALVTLSACQTALGRQITGEGMVGLSRAFFFAGAHAVMASLWNVNDESTADFMTDFYAALGRGQPIDDAARAAKLAFLHGDERLRHPYYWAAFVVSGDARTPVSVIRSRTPLVMTAGAASVALVAAAAWFVLRRRQSADRPAVPVR